MATLTALDLSLGPDLEHALYESVAADNAFCVLDRRLSPDRREDELRALGATHIMDENGTRVLPRGDEVDPEIGLVMLTSGSSGTPKAVEITWDALRASATLTQEFLRGECVPTWYPCLPAHHIGGLAVLLRAVLGDAQLLWGDTEQITSAPQRGATHVALVRAQLFRHDVSDYQAVLLGGARPPGDLPDNVIATWGMTETGSGIVYNGRALCGVQVVSVEGEICVKSPTLFRSYRDGSRPRIVGPDGADDWFPTGDAGEVRDGIVRVRGRRGFVINTGGEKVWPEDLEAVISGVRGVLDVAVTSRNDPEWGQRIVALIVSEEAGLDGDIAAAVAESVGPWAKPKELRYIQSIPRTPNGKIRRQALREFL